jgi:hypothetical protein
MIAERLRYQEHPGFQIRLYPDRNYGISMSGGQLDSPSRTHPQLVGILPAHVDEAFRKDSALRLIVSA